MSQNVGSDCSSTEKENNESSCTTSRDLFHSQTHKWVYWLYSCTIFRSFCYIWVYYRIAGNFRWCKFSHKMKIKHRIKFRNLNFRNRTLLYSTRVHVRTTVYDYTVQATPTCTENKISKVFIFAHTARFRIMRKFSAIRYYIYFNRMSIMTI